MRVKGEGIKASFSLVGLVSGVSHMILNSEVGGEVGVGGVYIVLFILFFNTL